MANKPISIGSGETRLVLQYAIASRLLVLTLIVLWRSLMSPYDTSASINPSCLTSEISDGHALFARIASALETSIVWESVYFVRIAQCDYEYEQYSESLYALLSIGGLYSFIHGANNTATLWFALSGAARSNGVLNAGYFGFQMMHRAYYAIFLKKHAFVALWMIVSGVFRCFCIFLPFLLFQAYGYHNICSGHHKDGMRTWCKARPPLLYNYIQSHYWGVGFLRYFQVKQLPNFALASPILSVAFWSIVYYVKLWPETFFSLGLGSLHANDELSASVFSLGTDKKSMSVEISERDTSSTQQVDAVSTELRKRSTKGVIAATRRQSKDKPSSGPEYLPVVILPFILHLSFMAATAFFVMHVQVATRFLSASPSLYWFASNVMATPKVGRRWGYIIWTYCASYILLGSLLFSNFYPFT